MLILLIEAGGIGIMTFAAATLLAIGHRLGIDEQQLIRDCMNYSRVSDIAWLIRRIVVVVVVVVVQAVGVALSVTDARLGL